MAPGVSSCHYCEVPPSISFSGSGFMATYQLGVAQCFLNYAPWILRTAPYVLGASAGSLVAAAVVCEMSLITIRDEMLHFAKQMKTFTLGPFNPSINVFHWLEFILQKYVPSDAHRLANGRLSVSMTRLSDGKHIVMTEFQSKEDIVQALLCSCFVPMYCGLLPPSFRGERYVDGGFSSMQPVPPASCSQILTVCPFSGEIDICPADEPCMWDMVVSGTTLKGNMANTFRICNALYPMDLKTLEQAYHNGYKDAIQFLFNHNLAPYLMSDKISQGLLNCDQSKMWTSMEAVIQEEKEDEEERRMKVEKEAGILTSFLTDRRTGSPSGCEMTGNQPIKEHPLHLDMVKNVLLGNVVTYLSMLGLPARILYHLLLPLTLSFYALLQSLELIFRQAPDLVVWAWHGLRHFTVFFFNICVCTVKKNIDDRIMPTILMLQWLTTARREAQVYTPQNKFPSSAH